MKCWNRHGCWLWFEMNLTLVKRSSQTHTFHLAIMATSTGRIAAIAVLSRLCVVALAAITVNSVATYDVSASIDPSATEGITTQGESNACCVALSPSLPKLTHTGHVANATGDKLVSRLFGHLGNWDGVFFIDVATTVSSSPTVSCCVLGQPLSLLVSLTHDCI